LIVAAPAKINLTLEVVGVEPNGYHLLDTVFCWLELEDTLKLEPASETSFSMSSVQVDLGRVESDESNLVLRALRAVEAGTGRALPTRIELEKAIPPGGGLGGGSADAAAAIFGLNILHDLKLTQHQMLELARPLGADVAFGLVGGAARGTRYGDILESVELEGGLFQRDLVLLMPGFGCPTPAVYGLWDQEPVHRARGASERFLSAVGTEDRLQAIANDLEEPAMRLQPELQGYKQAMQAAGLQAVTLSGSGSTLFGFVPENRAVDAIVQELSTPGAVIRKTRLKECTRFGLVS